jgi:hypothetical protein
MMKEKENEHELKTSFLYYMLHVGRAHITIVSTLVLILLPPLVGGMAKGWARLERRERRRARA